MENLFFPKSSRNSGFKTYGTHELYVDSNFTNKNRLNIYNCVIIMSTLRVPIFFGKLI